MPRTEIDINPVSHITVDALGVPGKRVFYLQGMGGSDPLPVTVIIEKIQLQNLVAGIEEVLEEISRQQPERITPLEQVVPDAMRITPPVDPVFRAGDLGLGYHAEGDLILIFAREILVEGQPQEDASMVRFWCTRRQVCDLADWGKQVLQGGRQVCPQCGAPMEPEGHFCPKKNGRRKH